jgi:hypothetical protein
MLVKATTALSVFLLISCHLLWHLLRRSTRRSPILLANSLALLAGVAIAFFALREWTHHADALKSLNPYGLKLTSTALHDWNFGKLHHAQTNEKFLTHCPPNKLYLRLHPG